MTTTTQSTGRCMCGCGRQTSLILKSDEGKGLVRGQYRHYCKGHHTRLSPVEYLEQDCGYETPCWVWQGGTTTLGYGRMWHDGAMRSAHRVYWEREHGPVPDDGPLDHLCRTPSCVRPSHLEAVTTAINTQRGLTTTRTPDDIREMRTRVANGDRQSDVARAYAMPRSTLSQIITRKHWANI